jgi:4-carboxymuconolactone decarboxylase
MTRAADEPATVLTMLDAATRALVRLSARITNGTEGDVREGLAECVATGVPAKWMEELVLQAYLFAGLPRALNAARELRRVRGDGRPSGGRENYASLYSWRLRGEETCRAVYGAMYEKLRGNIRGLHPALDDWMIVEGYGKVLSRDGLDLGRRELCIVAACVAAGQERQLHSHLHGARNVGVADGVVDAGLDALTGLAGVVADDALRAARLLWQRVKGRPRAR